VSSALTSIAMQTQWLNGSLTVKGGLLVAKVLIVGGDVATRQTLRALCGDLGWSVHAAADPRVALQGAAPRRVDLLLVIAEGGDDGEDDVLDQFAALRSEVWPAPLVVVVRGVDLPTRRRAFRLGAADVVCVSAALDEVRARLDAVQRHSGRHAHEGAAPSPGAVLS